MTTPRTRTRFDRLPLSMREQLKGDARRRSVARELVNVLPARKGTTIFDLSKETGHDRVDLANSLSLLRSLGLVVREGGKVAEWRYVGYHGPADESPLIEAVIEAS